MFAEAGNDTLNFIEEGEGEITLVFLHYFGGSSKSWIGVIDILKKSFHCIAIDLRGFGNSASPDKELSIHNNVKDVLDLIQVLKLKKYVLIGHSMGGKIALAIASQKPAGLFSLILIAPSLILIAPSPPTPEPSNHKDRIDMIIAFRDRSAIEKLIRKITAKPLTDILFENTVQDHFRVPQTVWNWWIENGSRENISFLMQNISVPILVVSGASDPNFSTKFLRKEFIKYFPAPFFEEIQEGGHLIPVEDPLEAANCIIRFLDKQDE